MEGGCILAKIRLSFLCVNAVYGTFELINHIRIGISNAEWCIAIMHMNEDVYDFRVKEAK